MPEKARGTWAILYGAYDTNTVGSLKEASDTVKEFFGLSYTVLFRASVYICVITVVLLGLSFVVGPVKEMGVNKAWAVRVTLIVILICSLLGIIQTVIDVSI